MLPHQIMLTYEADNRSARGNWQMPKSPAHHGLHRIKHRTLKGQAVYGMTHHFVDGAIEFESRQNDPLNKVGSGKNTGASIITINQDRADRLLLHFR